VELVWGFLLGRGPLLMVETEVVVLAFASPVSNVIHKQVLFFPGTFAV
jgi:hypothetical protein